MSRKARRQYSEAASESASPPGLPIPALFGSVWYTAAAAGAVWWLFFRKQEPKTVTTTVAVGQAVANGVVPNAAVTRPIVHDGSGTVFNSPTNSNPYAVEELLTKDALAKAENAAMTQGILKKPGVLSGFKQRNPYMVQ